jgi:hypothetical protein
MSERQVSFAAMHTLRIASCVVVALSLVACGGGDDGDSDKPVATSQLSGTIDGRSFTAVVALAEKGFDATEKFVEIYDVQRTCNDFAPLPTGGRSILFSQEWKPGNTQLSLSNNVTFVIQESGGPNNIIVTTGRLELVNTPTEVGQMGTVRLRASDGEDKVEGQVSVTICE